MPVDIDDKEFERIRLYTLASISTARYEHSERVAELAKELCIKFNEDENLGYFAGLFHDMCKEMDKKKLLEVAKKEKKVLSDSEKKRPSLLHGFVAAHILKETFNVKNDQVLEAISAHTFGKKDMCNLAKIVCIADKIEPGRPYMSSAKRENLLELSLDDMLEHVLAETVEKRRERNVEVFEEALWFYT